MTGEVGIEVHAGTQRALTPREVRAYIDFFRAK